MAAVKRVCVVGAGPSGLCAARLLSNFTSTSQSNVRFQVTIFEASSRIGGLWPTSRQDDGLVNPEMCANQSRHTVAYSDQAWEKDARQFPRAWEVGRYLEKYGEGLDVQLETKVNKATFDNDIWTVAVSGASGEKVLQFEHLVVASGFFGKPRLPKSVDGEMLLKGEHVIHSSRFRTIEALNLRPGGKNIVVVGGQMSGVEVAAAIAHQISSKAVSPGPNKDIVTKYTVTHVVQKPFWCMPFFFPRNPIIGDEINPAPDFLPLDLVSYDLTKRPPGPLTNSSGIITEAKAGPTHGFLERSIGNDQSDLGIAALSMEASQPSRSQPPFLGISDNYIELVRSGSIKVVQGKAAGGNEETITVHADGKDTVIEEVAAVILATGFEPSPSISFLPHELLNMLSYDPTADAFPLALNVHATVSALIPSLGFVGFYRSQYWGVIEMQARFLVQLWSGQPGAQTALANDGTKDYMMKVRHDPLCAQFPMGDYSYLMEDFASILGIQRYEPDDPSARTGIVFPARYSYTSTPETSAAIDMTYSTISTAGTPPSYRFTPRAISRSLLGTWTLNRHITSFNLSYPSGELTGTAKFLPRDPTPIENEEHNTCDTEYLYLEAGQFATTTGLTLNAKRSYVYRYSEASDKLTAWFAKEDRSVDYFFHELVFEKPEQEKEKGWIAKASHWCKPDQYEVEYEFRFKGATLVCWSWRYRVKGPDKDYEAVSRFTR